jgi:conjugative relaxase-like TrwC/TraI family protein
MLRITTNVSSAAAKDYFSTADYYSEGQELAGTWCGKAATLLGLSGSIQQKDWERLCDNLDPRNGAPLTVRHKSERRVGYDFTFNACKSVSLLYGLTQDQRLLDVVQKAANETMCEMETHMQTRVRRGGKNTDRTTGNLSWGEYVHLTSRPVNGIPDPHLHVHAFAFNVTWDAEEQRWKAGQFNELKMMAPYYEAVFQSKVASGMMELGLPVTRTQKGWELSGLDKTMLNKFSRRTAQIEELAKSKGITDPRVKSQLGAMTREKKQKELTMPELQQEWNARLEEGERDVLHRLIGRIGTEPLRESPQAAREAADYAVQHCFERDSAVAERDLLREALRRSYGAASRTAVERALASSNVIHASLDGKNMVTTPQMLAMEAAVIQYAREGRNACAPLGDGEHEFRRPGLSDEQKRAVCHVLRSTDRIAVVRGSAGVGKTTLLKEVVEAIEANGQKVFAYAPSAAASRNVLRSHGFGEADTVARLLVDKELRERLRGEVLLVDEAGLMGIKSMHELFALADRLDARIILVGDRNQHRAVDAGDPLSLLEDEAGIVPAQVQEIRRQRGEYRHAVADLSQGKIADGFHRLDAMGAIKELPPEERYTALADEYVESVRRGMRTLVVSPTHAEGNMVTDHIRTGLRDAGLLEEKQRSCEVLVSRNLTAAERGDPAMLSHGDVLVYHQNAPRHPRGQRLVVGKDSLPLKQAERYTVYRRESISLSPNDILRITKNGYSLEGKRINNGDIATVAGFTKKGDVRLTNGATLPAIGGHFTYGYVTTSHSSQSRSEDKVIIAQSAASFAASSSRQFYVSVSRGEKEISIYTDDRKAMLEAVSQKDEHPSATRLLADHPWLHPALLMQRRENQRTPQPGRKRELTHER